MKPTNFSCGCSRRIRSGSRSCFRGWRRMSESCRGLNDHFERCLPVKPCVVQCGLIQTGTHVERRPAQNLPKGWEWALFEDFCQSGRNSWGQVQARRVRGGVSGVRRGARTMRISHRPRPALLRWRAWRRRWKARPRPGLRPWPGLKRTHRRYTSTRSRDEEPFPPFIP